MITAIIPERCCEQPSMVMWPAPSLSLPPRPTLFDPRASFSLLCLGRSCTRAARGRVSRGVSSVGQWHRGRRFEGREDGTERRSHWLRREDDRRRLERQNRTARSGHSGKKEEKARKEKKKRKEKKRKAKPGSRSLTSCAIWSLTDNLWQQQQYLI